MATIYKEINKLGFMMVGYSAIKILGTEPTILLCRLLDEFNFAEKNKLECWNCFLTDLEQLENHLGFSDIEIIDHLNYLEKLNLLQIWDLPRKNWLLLRLNLQNIIKKIGIDELSNNFDYWDYQLMNTLKAKGYPNLYCESTINLRNTIIEYGIKLPEIIFITCDICIKCFEKKHNLSFWESYSDKIENELFKEDINDNSDDIQSNILKLISNLVEKQKQTSEPENLS